MILSNLIQGFLVNRGLDQAMIGAYSRAGDIAEYVNETYFSLRRLNFDLTTDYRMQSFLGATPSRILIVTQDERVAFDSGDEYSSDVVHLSSVKASLNSESSDSQVYLDRLNNHLMYTTIPLLMRDGDRASVLYIQDIESIFVQGRQLTSRMLLIGIPFVILSSMLVMYSSGRMLRPLHELKMGVEAMTRGRYDYEIQPEGGADDELQQISRSFNVLARRLYEIDQQQSEFVSNVSHELKTPIASMKIISQSLVESKDQVEKAVIFDFLEDISQESDRLSEIVDDLLYVATLQKRDVGLKLETRPIGRALEDAIHLIEPLAGEKNISLEYPKFDKILVEYDYNKMKQVFINLLSNAVKYTEAGGRVAIRQLSEKDDVLIEIEDNGIGIPAEDVEYIFDRFYRVDKHRSRQVGGTGLGLNITKQLISLHNGRIEVHSEAGLGSIFVVILPKRYQV
ncbi:MAG TPA: HAMP domain-containing histidine kinase [Tissierellia bacterium]|nr:HAMP domain-containing histidine kinase [Tissierellia bacterium]